MNYVCQNMGSTPQMIILLYVSGGKIMINHWFWRRLPQNVQTKPIDPSLYLVSTNHNRNPQKTAKLYHRSSMIQFHSGSQRLSRARPWPRDQIDNCRPPGIRNRPGDHLPTT